MEVLLSAGGLVLFLDFSNRTLMPGCSGEDALLVGELVCFFLELSSKNSMTKALCGSVLQ